MESWRAIINSPARRERSIEFWEVSLSLLTDDVVDVFVVVFVPRRREGFSCGWSSIVMAVEVHSWGLARF